MAPNYFENVKHPARIALIATALSMVIAVGGVAARGLHPSWGLGFVGLFIISLGADLAAYQYRDKNMPGNVWSWGWKQGSYLANTLVALGAAIILGAASLLFWY